MNINDEIKKVDEGIKEMRKKLIRIVFEIFGYMLLISLTILIGVNYFFHDKQPSNIAVMIVICLVIILTKVEVTINKQK